MEDISKKRLDVLKEEMIISHIENIDLNDTYEMYDSLLSLTFSGVFDNIFLSNNLEGLSEDEKARILELSRKYRSLCFYGGKFDNWLDSIDGVSLSNLDLISIKLLDSYDSLIKLAKDGGEETLKFLTKFQNSEVFKEDAVIPALKNRFLCDEDLMDTILIEMSREDGKYKDFTNTQKMIMCNSPEGVLYRRNNQDDLELILISELKDKIGSDSIKDLDSKVFAEIIEEIEYEYLGAVYKKQ